MLTLSQLPPQTTKLLKTFTEESDKTIGLSDQITFERFCMFAVASHAETASINHEALYSHLKESNWPEEQADAAAKRYKAARYLLSLYDQYKAGQVCSI